MAGPASPDILEIEQSGIGIKLINKGDEYQGWTETINGYTVLKTPSGIFEYAQKTTMETSSHQASLLHLQERH